MLLITSSEWLNLSWVHFITWFTVFIGAAITFSFWSLQRRVKELEITALLLIAALGDLTKKELENERRKYEMGSGQQKDK